MLCKGDKVVNVAARQPKGDPAEAEDLSASSLPLLVKANSKLMLSASFPGTWYNGFLGRGIMPETGRRIFYYNNIYMVYSISFLAFLYWHLKLS